MSRTRAPGRSHVAAVDLTTIPGRIRVAHGVAGACNVVVGSRIPQVKGPLKEQAWHKPLEQDQ